MPQPKGAGRPGLVVTPNAFVRDLDLGAFNGLDGRRIVIADGLPTGHRHHVGVSSPAGWDSEEGSRKARRGGSGGSAAQERDHVPGVSGRGRTSPSGGVGCRNGGPVVRRDGPFPPKSCEGEGRVCATPDAEPSEGRVVEEVELHPGVQRRECIRFVSPGQAPQSWHRGLHPLRARGGAGRPLRLTSRTGRVASVDL